MNSKLFIIAALIVGVAVTGLVSTIGPQLAKAQTESQDNNQQQQQNVGNGNNYQTQTNKQCTKNGVEVPCKRR